MLSASLVACPASTISLSQCEVPYHRSAQLQISSVWSCRKASIVQWPRLKHSVQKKSPGRHSEHQADQMTHIPDCHLLLEYLCISNCPCSLLVKCEKEKGKLQQIKTFTMKSKWKILNCYAILQ